MPPGCALLGGFAIGPRVALLWQHYGNAWQSPAVSRQAHRTPHPLCHALRMPATTPLASANIAAFAVPSRPYCGGVVTRTRNVSEYMLVLAHVPSCVYCSSFLQLNRTPLLKIWRGEKCQISPIFHRSAVNRKRVTLKRLNMSTNKN